MGARRSRSRSAEPSDVWIVANKQSEPFISTLGSLSPPYLGFPLERESAALLDREQSHQTRIDEQFLAPNLDLLKDADASQLLQVDGRRLALRDARLDHV